MDRGATPYRSPLLRRVDCGCPERAVGDSEQRATGGQAPSRCSGLFSEHRGSEPADQEAAGNQRPDPRACGRSGGGTRTRKALLSPMSGKRSGKRAGLDLRESADHPHPHLPHGGGRSMADAPPSMGGGENRFLLLWPPAGESLKQKAVRTRLNSRRQGRACALAEGPGIGFGPVTYFCVVRRLGVWLHCRSESRYGTGRA